MSRDDLWTRADKVLEAALDTDPSRRRALIREMCGDDEQLRERVERLVVFAESDSAWLRHSRLQVPEAAGGGAPAGDRDGGEGRGGLAAGTRLGPYEVVRRLGAGGMGVVYRARDPRIGRDVAIKLLPPHIAADERRTNRFLQEAKLASTLNHPNILTIHEVDVGEAGPYIVSEVIEGPTLRTMARNRPVSPDEAVDVFRQAATGLGKAHAAGVVHRDIKPDNLMITPDGIVKILDFGIAKALAPDLEPGSLTQSGLVAGTPGYISPEQLRGETADASGDVFSLGVVIYELLAEEHPFAGATVAEVINATLTRTPPPLSRVRDDVPEALSSLVARCLSRSPAERPPNGAALVVELHEGASPAGRSERAVRGVMGRVAGLLDSLFGERQPAAPEPGAAARPARIAAEDLVVAVLPVKDHSGDPALESVGAGRILTDVFLHLLTDGAQLNVVSPFLLQETAARDRRRVQDAVDDPAYARALGMGVGANSVLTGTLDRLSGSYVLGATITELATGRIRRSYRVQAAEWERLLSELASTVQEGQPTPPTPATPPPAGLADAAATPAPASAPEQLVERLPSRTLEAYANFIRGRDLADQGHYREALEPLEKAVELDPELAVAWSEIGCAYFLTGDNVRGRAAHWKAAEHVNHASLKEKLWIASTTVWVHTENGPLYRRRLQEFVDAFPDDRDGPRYMGHSYLMLDKDPASAIPWLRKADELTPGFYPTVEKMAEAHVALGERDAARELLRDYLERPGIPDFGRSSARAFLDKLGSD